MAIRFACSCGKELQAREEHAGRLTRCPECGKEMVIPQASTEVQAAPTPTRESSGAEIRRDREFADEDDDLEDRPRRPTKTGTSGKAWASLILGLLSFGCTVVAGIPAVIAGIMSLREIGASEGRLKGHGLAISGIVLGAIGSLLVAPVFIIAVLIGLLVPAVQKVREAAARIQSSNNLHQIALAMHNYNAAFGHIPPGNVKAAGPGGAVVPNYGNPGLSWRVALLPFLEQDDLYKQFRLDEPWDSAHNKALLTKMPKIYAHANADPAKTAAGFTHYRAFVGPGTAFDPTAGRVRLPLDFPDGTTNTLLVVEAADPIEWTRPETDDFQFAPNKPLPRLANFWSTGTAAALADGSVHMLQKGISEQTLRALITRNGNDVVGPDF